MKLSSFETTLAGLAVALMLATFAFRVRLFLRQPKDPELVELLEDTSPTTGLDLLAFHLAARWRRLSDASRKDALPFVIPYLTSVALCLAGVATVMLRLAAGT